MAKHADNKREALLWAAAEQVMEFGLEKLTLEGVAARAGVSKGGLLYHFPNKEALVEGMGAALLREFDAALEVEIARDRAARPADDAGRVLRAYVSVSTRPDETFDTLLVALLGGVAQFPRLLETQRGFIGAWQKRLENDGVDPDLAAVIRLAADGCWMSEVFGFEGGFESPARQNSIRATLFRLIDEGVAAFKIRGSAK